MQFLLNVTHRYITRQRPQHARGQHHRSSVFCGPRKDHYHATPRVLVLHVMEQFCVYLSVLD
jgi:hypothetical protein